MVKDTKQKRKGRRNKDCRERNKDRGKRKEEEIFYPLPPFFLILFPLNTPVSPFPQTGTGDVRGYKNS